MLGVAGGTGKGEICLFPALNLRQASARDACGGMNAVGSFGRTPSQGKALRPRGPSGDAGTLFLHPHTPISLLLVPGTASGHSPVLRVSLGERRRNPLGKQPTSGGGKRGDPGAREPEICREGRGAAGRTPLRACPAAAPRGEGRREGRREGSRREGGRARGEARRPPLTLSPLSPRGAAALLPPGVVEKSVPPGVVQ